jgi:hypothetical protein
MSTNETWCLYGDKLYWNNFNQGELHPSFVVMIISKKKSRINVFYYIYKMKVAFSWKLDMLLCFFVWLIIILFWNLHG